MMDTVSSSRRCTTVWVTEPAVAGATGTSVIFTDSAPSGRTSSTRSNTRLPEDEPETVSVVAQLKSTPRWAVPFVGPVNRNCTEADPE